MLRPAGLEKIDHFFRTELGIDLTEETLNILIEGIKNTFSKLFYKAEERAQANGRDFIELSDLCITKSLEIMIDTFKKIEKDLGVDELLEYISFIPPVNKQIADDLKSEYRNILGGLLLMYGEVIKYTSPESKPDAPTMRRINKLVDLVF